MSRMFIWYSRVAILYFAFSHLFSLSKTLNNKESNFFTQKEKKMFLHNDVNLDFSRNELDTTKDVIVVGKCNT